MMIQKILEVFENLNEIVYASDVETYDLVYMNRKAREMFGNVSPDEYINKKCYSLLQGCGKPCEMCTNNKLKVGEFYEWIFYNPIVDRKYALKDTLFVSEGKEYRVEIAIDITVQRSQSQLIQSLVNNEAIMGESIKMALEEEIPDKSIMKLLEYMGKAFKGERAYIFENTAPGYVANTYEWCAEDVSVQIENLENLTKESLKDWYDVFNQGKSVIIKDLEEIKEESPSVYEILKPQDITTLVVCPLVYQKEIIGFYGIDNPPVEMFDHIMTMLNVMSNFIVSIINRRDLFNKLLSISYYDRLTGAGNRYAMDELTSHIDKGESIGVVYGDVMELKIVNDTKGHMEGDKLLLDSYDHLLRHFDKKNIFRIGGDEFVVVVSSISRDDFEKKIAAVKEDMKNSTAKIALGYIWKENTNDEEVQNLILQADQLMYEEKRRYHNEKRKKKSDCSVPCRESVLGLHEYFMQEYGFHSEAFFKSIMQSSFGLKVFVGDLQSDIYYLSDTLRETLKTEGNMVYKLFETLKEVLPSDEQRENWNKTWEEMLENKMEKVDFKYDVHINGENRVGIMRLEVRWNGDIPLFCTGILMSEKKPPM